MQKTSYAVLIVREWSCTVSVWQWRFLAPRQTIFLFALELKILLTMLFLLLSCCPCPKMCLHWQHCEGVLTALMTRYHENAYNNHDVLLTDWERLVGHIYLLYIYLSTVCKSLASSFDYDSPVNDNLGNKQQPNAGEMLPGRFQTQNNDLLLRLVNLNTTLSQRLADVHILKS